MKRKLVIEILLGFIIGLAVGVGLWMSGVDVAGYVKWVSPFGSALVGMLKMLVIPVIFLSLIAGAASLPTSEFGKIGIRVIVWYFATSLFAAVVGSILALGFNPGGSPASMSAWKELVTQGGVEAVENTGSSLVDVILGMFENPFAALANGDFLAIIVFSIAFGIALKLLAESNEKANKHITVLLDLIDVTKDAIFKMVDWVLAYSPIGVFALTSVNFCQYGANLFGPYVKLAAGVITGILCMILVIYPLMMAIVLRINPYIVMNKMKEAILTAFVTRSSAASLPVSLRVSKEELGVKESLASFGLPLGATINMDGVCVHLPMFAVLAANMFGMDMNFTQLAILVLTTVLVSVGAGGVPGGSLMLLFIILENMGLGTAQIAIIVGLALGINPILDMFETMNNVTGDLVCTYTVAKMSNMIDESQIKNR